MILAFIPFRPRKDDVGAILLFGPIVAIGRSRPGSHLPITMTNAPLHFRPQLPSPVHMARGTLASPVSPVLGRERPSVPVRVSTFTPVTGVPVRSDRPSSPPAPTSSPAFAESASASHSGIVALTPGASSFSLAKVWSAVRESYGASKPTFREGVIFLSTVAVLFAFATILLDLGR